MKMYYAVLALAVSLTCLQGTVGVEVRGLNPDKKHLYNPGKDFTCLDGSTTVPYSLVNDDYCDCSDGSDEPGTAACTSGRFYCQNAGHKSMEVLSSRVNDGICDCCDGTDEWDSDAHCQNTCIEMGRQAAEDLKRMKELHEQGYLKRLEQSTEGKQKTEESRSTLAEKEAELVIIKAELTTLQAAKETAEEPETEAKDKHREAWEQDKEKRTQEKRISDAQTGFNELDTNSDGFVSVEEIQARDELDDDGDGTVSETEALEYLDNAQQINFDTFLESVWDLVSDKCQFKKKVVEDEPLLPTPPVDFEKEDDPNDYDYDDEEDEDDEVEEVTDDDNMPEYDEETKALIAAADEARDAYRTAEQKKNNFEQDVRNLNKFLGMDFGHDNEFSHLYENCYDYTDLEYTYTMCAFSKVSQKPKNGGRETSLGTWGMWSGDKKYSIMKYENGEKCWNGPSRSATVTLTCGLEDQLLSASEPNRCEYAMEFSTPAVCEQNKHPHTEL